MATRRISTILAVDGEKEYKAAIANCNSELKTLKSALSLVESEFKGNANSMAALTAKGENLNQLHAKQTEKVRELEKALNNCQNAQEVYNKRIADASEKIQINEKKLEELKNTKGDTSEEQQKLTEETERYKKELAEAEAGLEAAKRGANNWEQQLNNSKVELNSLNEKIEQNNQHMSEAAQSADNCAVSIDRFGKEVTVAKESALDFGETSSAAIETLASTLVAAGVAAKVKTVADALRACIDAAIEFEHSLAGLQRTTGVSNQDLAEMGAYIKQLSTEIPLTTSELAGIAATAGQLGIANQDVMAFTEMIAVLGTTTDASAGQAAYLLAKFMNLIEIDPADFGRLGSSIAKLGDNSATSATTIIQMSQRMEAAAAIAGFSAQEVLALSAAVSSVGLSAQAGGTAMSTLIQNIHMAVATGDGLEGFAATANMTADEFAQAWGDNAVNALTAFNTGLKNSYQSGEDAIVILRDLGITGIQQAQMILSLAQAGDLLTDSIDMANQAWNENTLLQKNANTMYATTQSRMIMMENSVNNLQIAIGSQLTPSLDNLIDVGSSAFVWATDFIEEQPWIVNAITGLVVSLSLLTAGSAVLALGITKKVLPALKALKAAMMANPILLVATAITGLVVALGTYIASQERATDSVRELNRELREKQALYEAQRKEVAEQNANLQNLIDTYFDLLEASENCSNAQASLILVGKELIALLPELANYFNELTGEIALAEEQVRGFGEASTEYADMSVKVEQLTDMQAYLTRVTNKLAEAQGALTEAYDNHIAASEDLANSYIRCTRALEEASDEWFRQNQIVNQLTSNKEELEAQIAELSEETRDFTEAQRIANEAAAEAAALFEANQAAVAEMEKSIESLVGEMEALAAAYDAAYEAAYNSLTRQFGLFNELDGTATRSIESLISALDSQIEFMYTYAENIQKAMELGVDEGLIQKLSDGSEESARILAAIVEDGGENIDELNERLALVEEGKDRFAHQIAEMETDYSASMQRLVDETNAKITEMTQEMDVAEGAFLISVENVNSLIAGAESKRAALVEQYRSLAQSALDAYRAVMAQMSPSRKMMESGRNDIMGQILGAESMRARLIDTYESLATAAYTASQRAMPRSIKEPSVVERQSFQTGQIVNAITSESIGRGGLVIENLTQIINADEADPAGQQRQARRELQELAREIA